MYKYEFISNVLNNINTSKGEWKNVPMLWAHSRGVCNKNVTTKDSPFLS